MSSMAAKDVKVINIGTNAIHKGLQASTLIYNDTY